MTDTAASPSPGTVTSPTVTSSGTSYIGIISVPSSSRRSGSNVRSARSSGTADVSNVGTDSIASSFSQLGIVCGGINGGRSRTFNM